MDRADPALSVAAQCRLLKVARSTLYYQPARLDADDLALMRRMDELYTKWPFYGSRRMVAALRQDGWIVNRKRVRRLMRMMGVEAIYQKPNTSKGRPDHKVYPYLLRGLSIDRPNQVWCADITYIPMAKGFVYLVAVMDWFSRRVLSWRLSITMEADFSSRRYRRRSPGMVSPISSIRIKEFSSPARGFLMIWKAAGIRVSMDGKGRFLDNIFIERLWRSLKYEDVFIKAYGSVAEARAGHRRLAEVL